MYCNIFFSFMFSFMISHYTSLCLGHWITDSKLETSSNITDNVTEKSNETEFFKGLIENNSNSTVEKGDIFWTIFDINANATEANLEFQKDAENMELWDSKDKLDLFEEKRNDTALTNGNLSADIEIDRTNSSHVVLSNEADELNLPMYEKILLQRSNCHLEISISEIHDLKVEIRFGKMENTTSGECCLTLNGHKNNTLGVLISNIHLYENGLQRELLKVVIPIYGMDFVLKEYYPRDKYEPLLLTETHKVYIVLYYNVTYVPFNEEDTHFNLEVFSYGKNENYIHHEHSYSQSGNF